MGLLGYARSRSRTNDTVGELQYKTRDTSEYEGSSNKEPVACRRLQLATMFDVLGETDLPFTKSHNALVRQQSPIRGAAFNDNSNVPILLLALNHTMSPGLEFPRESS